MEEKPDSVSHGPRQRERDRAYWKANLRLILILIGVWAFVSVGCSVLFVEQLNRIQFGKVPLGFWMNQQGSIYVFVLLIAIYVWRMQRMDDRHEAQLREDGE